MPQPAHDPLRLVRESLLRNYFKDGNYLASDLGQKDLAARLELRLTANRERIILWIESFLNLVDARQEFWLIPRIIYSHFGLSKNRYVSY